MSEKLKENYLCRLFFQEAEKNYQNLLFLVHQKAFLQTSNIWFKIE